MRKIAVKKIGELIEQERFLKIKLPSAEAEKEVRNDEWEENEKLERGRALL